VNIKLLFSLLFWSWSFYLSFGGFHFFEVIFWSLICKNGAY
jgi:hypothetical protein